MQPQVLFGCQMVESEEGWHGFRFVRAVPDHHRWSSGVAVVEAALERNYHVVAFARDQQRLNRELGHLMGHASLEVALGEISDLTALLSAMQGAQACRKCQIERLIVQGCALASAPGEWWGLLTPARLARAVVRWQNSSKAIDDAEAVMKYLYNEAKDVKWVVARPVWLEEMP
eukprot:g16327.t1